jgi:BMFP domain-containing protein YqiC
MPYISGVLCAAPAGAEGACRRPGTIKVRTVWRGARMWCISQCIEVGSPGRRATLYTGRCRYCCEDVMNPTQWMEELQKNISDLIARSPAADIERNVRAMLTQGFSRLDLVTREEFDVQAELLARTIARADVLATQVAQLEARINALEASETKFGSPT